MYKVECLYVCLFVTNKLGSLMDFATYDAYCESA